MSVSGQEICRLAEEAAEASDPEVALEILTRLRGELDEFERQQVARALTAGRSFGEIARRLGVSRQAVHRRFKNLRRRRGAVSGLPPTPEVRLVVEYAGAEGEALDARALVPAHLLLGILRNGDRHAAAALTAAGVSLEAAREAVREAGGAARSGDESLRAVLGAAVRVARRAGEERIEVAHLLEAALDEGDGAVAQVLDRAGAAPEQVLEALGSGRRPDPSCLEA